MVAVAVGFCFFVYLFIRFSLSADVFHVWISPHALNFVSIFRTLSQISAVWQILSLLYSTLFSLILSLLSLFSRPRFYCSVTSRFSSFSNGIHLLSLLRFSRSTSVNTSLNRVVSHVTLIL